jgi:HAAS
MMISAAPSQNSEPTPKQKIEAYLRRLRLLLRGIDPEQVGEIVEELRSHIVERAGSDSQVSDAKVDATLAALGTPEQLASEYLTDNLLARAEVSRSPIQILKSLFRWASLSAVGFFVLLSAIVGYFFGIVFILVAVAKLFHPRTAGLWRLPGSDGGIEFSFRMGFGAAPAGGKDVLGWWIVPIGWMAGLGFVMLTTYFAVWFVKQYRKSRVRGR